ncbi:glycoside hydrolase family 6 protein [Microbacterium sp. PRF11]|uniref:glycoside hydrolase family 6 protein n=1 Tax=Microbacterium sp. PRF11 TaxID=2962593 RepID=UPI002882C9FC|nr:glycoside hydrolase family 6 protein [Microbacterium sp. PRF11]MDT0116667.1 glycoside hydrolase family 6 protein [Microbacterium sp. PRF11]
MVAGTLAAAFLPLFIGSPAAAQDVRAAVTAQSPNPLASGPALPTYSAAAEAQKAATAAGRTSVAKQIAVIAGQPTAVWLGEWYDDAALVRVLQAETQTAAQQKKTAVFVLYAIPARDCGLHSSGGFDAAGYQRWARLIAQTLRGTPSVAIVEPDALAMLGSCEGQGDRLGLIADAVRTLADAGVPAYIDAGNSNWVPAETMAQRLRDAGVSTARGFSTNISNFQTTTAEQRYAERVRALLGGTARYVIDTSRNGRGWTGDWCNPSGVGLGTTPRAVTGSGGLDALLWIKRPGESDGLCNGGPAAGSWFEKAALDLVALRKR